ncbi:hypothetical protein DFJ63DRAFT_286860 [Scheffersomyces coipomensis]|uniref:uncharacterized protein n=1 Tax=Scheffersomyces coipomensis TaxID=1788519 RepID=UPI00315D8322
MDQGQFSQLISRFDKSEVFDYLTQLNRQLTSTTVDSNQLQLYLSQLNQIIEVFNIPPPSTKKSKNIDHDATSPHTELRLKVSLNLIRLLSRNLTSILTHLPTKIYDIANNLLNNINELQLSYPIFDVSVIVLIDLYESFPNSLGSLTNYSVSQIYKIFKKNSSVNNHNLIYLLNSITKNATKNDIDEKFQAKLLKGIIKNINTLSIKYDVYEQESNTASSSTTLLKRNYILCLKNILVLSVQSNYETLLTQSASSSGSSSSSKLKPEVLMQQQHQYQLNILATHEKLIQYCLSNFNQDIRVAAVELLAQLFINFIPTGKFNAIDYIIEELYILPLRNNYSPTLMFQLDSDGIPIDGKRVDTNSVQAHDSESIIQGNISNLLIQTSLIETLILYMQLEQFQNPEYLSSNLTFILDTILLKFRQIIPNQLLNSNWNKVLTQFKGLIDYIIREAGSNCNDILLNYVYARFNDLPLDSNLTDNHHSHEKKSGLFSLKPKSNKHSSRKDEKVEPYRNSFQTYLLLHIVELLLPFGVNNLNPSSATTAEEKPTTIERSAAPPKEGEIDIPEDQEFEESSKLENSFIRDILFKLIINENSYIRNYALKALLVYIKNNVFEINQIILQIFKLVEQEYKHSEEHQQKVEIKLIGYSLVLSSLIKQTDWQLLQNTTIVKILSFCTQNLKHNNNNNSSGNKFLKSSSCWIILSSLVTFYNESEFVKLNSSQYLIFWKNLLTSQFISPSFATSSESRQRRDIIEDLKLRNFSLVCLLNYLNSVELTPESLKQIQFLLTKSYNYLSYLESNLESVGGVTNFSPSSFNDCEYNPNLLNNIHYTSTAGISFENIMISLILYSKKILLQSFSKLIPLLKNDVNSNMVLFFIKVFSDSKLFSRSNTSDIEKISKSKKNNAAGLIKDFDFDNSVLVLNEDYNYAFGVTSKFDDTKANIDELLIKFKIPKSHKNEGLSHSDIFTKSIVHLPKSKIESKLQNEFPIWIDFFEELIFKSVDNSINYDPNIYLTQNYSSYESFSANLVTSIIDLSIELFQLVFPYLSVKIQFSLVEQLRNSLTASSIDPLRLKAMQVNITVTLHGLLNNLIRKKYTLDKEVALVIIDILQRIDTTNVNLFVLNSDSIGLAIQLLPKALVGDQTSKFVADIVNDTNPFKRGFSILSLSQIFKRTGSGFNETYNIILQLINDPNPIVYHYTIQASVILFENNFDSTNFIPGLLNLVYDNFLKDDFGYDINHTALLTLKCKYRSIGLVTRLLKLFITNLGPSLREWPAVYKIMIKNLIMSTSQGIGSASIRDYSEVYSHLLSLFQELIIYDASLIDGEVPFFTDLLKLIISKNLKIGLSSVSPTSMFKDWIFPLSTSYGLYKGAYECYVELLKIFGVDVLNKETVNMLWVSMNMQPCSELKQFIKLWLESTSDMNWFTILNSLFKCSSKKLIGPFIELNYQQKLLPLSQRTKKEKVAKVDFKDEEIENIVGDNGDDSDKNEPITWEFKLFIYDLLNHLLELAEKNNQLLDKLKEKIQDIVKISFLGSTSPITEIKIRGINLLDKALGLFGHLPDPLYPSVSILEQQQAQIISALIPCFAPGNDSTVIVNAINVSSKFISLPRIKFYSKQRILKTLIYLLEEISSNKFLRFSFLEDMSEFGRKSIQLSILNCWALVKIESLDEEFIEPELQETLEKYSKLLISLWILVLREYSTLRYNNDSSVQELEIYQNYWINFIGVLSIELENNGVDKFLENGSIDFFFVLFSLCVESLIKNKNIGEILVSLNRLVHNSELVELIFKESIFEEVVDLFDRLILIDDDIEIQCALIDIINIIFNTYVDNHKSDLANGFDKLFELVRVGMLPLFGILPFLRSDFDPSNDAQVYLIKQADSAHNLLVLKKAFSNLIEMTSRFDDVIKVDLYSCLLYIFAKIYENANKLLISIILPYLKTIVTETKKFNEKIVQDFSNLIHSYYSINVENNYSVITTMILITCGDYRLDNDESKELSSALIKLLESSDTKSTGIQCIKSLVQYSATNTPQLTVKYLIGDLIKLLVGDGDQGKIEPTVKLEVLLMYTKNVSEESNLNALYSILIPLLVKFNDSSIISKTYLHERLLFLVNKNAASFKLVVTDALTETQRKLTEDLIKLDINHETNDGSSDPFDSNEEQIKLKTFGA